MANRSVAEPTPRVRRDSSCRRLGRSELSASCQQASPHGRDVSNRSRLTSVGGASRDHVPSQFGPAESSCRPEFGAQIGANQRRHAARCSGHTLAGEHCDDIADTRAQEEPRVSRQETVHGGHRCRAGLVLSPGSTLVPARATTARSIRWPVEPCRRLQRHGSICRRRRSDRDLTEVRPGAATNATRSAAPQASNLNGFWQLTDLGSFEASKRHGRVARQGMAPPGCNVATGRQPACRPR